MRTSDRGSAVVEFLLLVFPIGLLSTATIGVGWFSFAKTELRVIASEVTFQLAQPDSDIREFLVTVDTKMFRTFGNLDYRVQYFSANGLSEVVLSLPLVRSFGILGGITPQLKVQTHAANEI
ncbi:MAG: hypothetical protein NTX78_01055 [Rhodoluna sp.]|nr:hypothetical protein [Rhodoluna sp.]